MPRFASRPSRFLRLFCLLPLFGAALAAAVPRKPNIVYLLANDLGWGEQRLLPGALGVLLRSKFNL